MAVPPKSVPRHIAIIMDGNGRWAAERGLPRLKGHEQGAEAVRAAVEACGDLKVPYLTLYAFSAENWQRPKTEVMALMRLLEKFLKQKTPELLEKNVRLQAIGRLTDLPLSCQRQLHESIERTAANDGLTLILALSYGARLEIIDGIHSLLRELEAGHIHRYFQPLFHQIQQGIDGLGFVRGFTQFFLLFGLGLGFLCHRDGRR